MKGLGESGGLGGKSGTRQLLALLMKRWAGDFISNVAKRKATTGPGAEQRQAERMMSRTWTPTNVGRLQL